MSAQRSHKNGRPTKYKSSYAELAHRLCLIGLTDAQVAFALDVSEQTINNWKRRHPEFAEAMKSGKTVADAEVAHALYKRAIGYETTEEKVINSAEGPTTITVKKNYPPDAQAARFWLKNRQPHLWKEKVEVATPITAADFPSEEELNAIYKRSMEKAKKRAEEMDIYNRGEKYGMTIDNVGEDIH